MSSAFETGQIFIELEEFDMHELIAYSDLVVSIYSSVIQEAIDAGKTALAFCTKGLDELYPLYELAPDLVADNGKQLFDRINDCLDNHVTLDNMVSLRKELGCGCDGKVVQRIREGLVSLAEDNCHN
jgi:CDP-glycerol glycerophosphotransferase (TagB/SpsB family)